MRRWSRPCTRCVSMPPPTCSLKLRPGRPESRPIASISPRASLKSASLTDVNAQAKRFADLRLAMPRLVDMNDPQSLPVCSPKAPVRYYWIAAVDAKTVLTDGSLIYHRFRPGTVFSNPARNTNDSWRAAHDPTGLMYVRVIDLDSGTGQLRQDRKIEPLILRGRAGECLSVMLTNTMKPSDMDSFANLPSPSFNINQLRTTERVGIHAQSLRKHVGTNDGINVGRNPVQTILPGQSRRYEWYAGVVDWQNSNAPAFQPVEFGALNLMPADPIKQGGKGLFGAIVIQPADSYWGFDTTPPEPFSSGTVPLATRASAVVFGEKAPYRDFVLVGQDDANLRLSGSRSARSGTLDPQDDGGVAPPVQLPGTPFDEPVRRVAQCVGAADDAIRTMCEVRDEEVDAVDAAHKAFNYRSEAGWMRRVHSAAMPRSVTLLQRQNDLLSDGFNGINSRNQTPRFCALPGDAVRMRVLFPNGHGRNHVIEVAGHNWDDQPFVNNSTELGEDPLSTHVGTRDTVGPGSNWNMLLSHGAGGSNSVAGDYQVRDTLQLGLRRRSLGGAQGQREVRVTMLKLAAAVAAAVILSGAGPAVKVNAVQGGLDTGSAMRLSVTTAARSEAGNSAQPPFAWIDYEETVDPAAATCERRAERLLGSGPLQPAARDFNNIHVAMLDSAGSPARARSAQRHTRRALAGPSRSWEARLPPGTGPRPTGSSGWLCPPPERSWRWMSRAGRSPGPSTIPER